MILDKLMEKKDLIAYIDNRINNLRGNLKPEKLLRVAYRSRKAFIIRTKAKISELRKLKQVVNDDKLKELSKRYCKENNKISNIYNFEFMSVEDFKELIENNKDVKISNRIKEGLRNFEDDQIIKVIRNAKNYDEVIDIILVDDYFVEENL